MPIKVLAGLTNDICKTPIRRKIMRDIVPIDTGVGEYKVVAVKPIPEPSERTDDNSRDYLLHDGTTIMWVDEAMLHCIIENNDTSRS